MMNVFVYGTLREGERNHYLLKDAICIARQCSTEGKMYDSHSGYPYLSACTGSCVYGEVYEVNDRQLQALDHLEGYVGPGKNNLYERRIQMIQTEQGTLEAFVYMLPVAKKSQKMDLIESGDWCSYRK